MKSISIRTLILLLCCSFVLQSCSTPKSTARKNRKRNKDKNEQELVIPVVYPSAEVSDPPVYPGGETDMERYFEQAVQYPKTAYENFVVGEVIVGFVIDETGAVTNPHIIKGLGFGCDEEVMRVVKSMPPWQPARHDGEVVSVSYQVPVNFSLELDLGE